MGSKETMLDSGYVELEGRRRGRRGFAVLAAFLVAGLVGVTYTRNDGGTGALTDGSAKVDPGLAPPSYEAGLGNGAALDGAAAAKDIAEIAEIAEIAARNGTSAAQAAADARALPLTPPLPEERRVANATGPAALR